MADNTQKVKAVLAHAGISYTNSDDKEIRIETGGPSPMDLLLMAVAGCSGLTLGSLLERDGLSPEKLELTVEGVKNQERPRKYTKIFIKYDIRCQGLIEEALDKYLKITERVCPVVQSLSAECDFTYTLNQ
ncbi:MAG: OsmC family protein [Bacillota bacterium]|jgi:putative redox protein